MRPRMELMAVAVGLAMAVALVVAGIASAQTPQPAPEPSASKPKTNYGEYFLDRMAAALKVDRQALTDAARQARNEVLDRAVQEGRLTEKQAEALRSRMDTAAPHFGFRLPQAAPKVERPLLRPMVAPAIRDALAEALGMSVEELTAELKGGKTLKQLAQEKGKEQVARDVILKLLKGRLDQAVASGRITQQQADQLLDRLRKTDLLARPANPSLIRPEKPRLEKSRPDARPWNRPATVPARTAPGNV